MNKPLRIVTVSSHETPLPPPITMIRAAYMLSINLAEALQHFGITVSYLTSKKSTLTTPMIPMHTPSLLEQITLEEYYSISDPMVRGEYIEQVRFELYSTLFDVINNEHVDCVHFHTDIPITQTAVAKKLSIPSVFTIHSNAQNPLVESKIITPNLTPQQHMVAISHAQAKLFSYLPIQTVIHNGIPLKQHQFNPHGGNVLLFAGRFKKTKGIQTAITAAVATKHILFVAGTTSYSDSHFYTTTINPMVKTHQQYIKLLDIVDRNTISSFYQQGKVLLFPIEWEEPFGLVLIESMAAGTPVIAFARGSTSEIIKDGQTGFLINPSPTDIRGDFVIKQTGIKGIEEAIERIYSMSEQDYLAMRYQSRQHVEHHFTIEQTAQAYASLFERIITT